MSRTRILLLSDAPFNPTLYFLSSTTGGWGELQVGGTAPSDATLSTGWRTEGLSAGQYARMEFGVVRAASVFSGTAQPSGGPDNTLKDCWRTASALTGDFAAGNWTAQLPLIAPDAGTEGADLRIRLRFWKSANADGSSPTEITSGAQVGSSVATLQSEDASISVVGPFALGAVTLTNEYLFVQVAAETT